MGALANILPVKPPIGYGVQYDLVNKFECEYLLLIIALLLAHQLPLVSAEADCDVIAGVRG